MTLAEYLKDHGLTATEFGRRIGVSSEAVRRYRDGTRIPEHDIMVRIADVTKGKVMPNDFYRTNVESAAGRDNLSEAAE